MRAIIAYACMKYICGTYDSIKHIPDEALTIMFLCLLIAAVQDVKEIFK